MGRARPRTVRREQPHAPARRLHRPHGPEVRSHRPALTCNVVPLGAVRRGTSLKAHFARIVPLGCGEPAVTRQVPARGGHDQPAGQLHLSEAGHTSPLSPAARPAGRKSTVPPAVLRSGPDGGVERQHRRLIRRFDPVWVRALIPRHRRAGHCGCPRATMKLMRAEWTSLGEYDPELEVFLRRLPRHLSGGNGDVGRLW